MDMDRISLQGTPVLSGLTPVPVLDSMLDKLSSPTASDFLDVLHGTSVLLDVREFATGLATGKPSEILQGLLGLTDELQDVLELRQRGSMDVGPDDGQDQGISLSM
jgi:hypothetical protein